MSQGDLTKQNAETCMEALLEMFSAIPNSKQINFLGHLNEISLFLGKCVKEMK